MDPATLAVVSLATTAISAGVGAMGSIQQGQATAAASNYQAQVAKNNAITAEQNAAYATQAGTAKAQSQDFQTAAVVGAEQAGQGASGIDLTTGSPRAVREGTHQMGRLGTLNIVQDANLTAYGYRTQGTSFTAQSQLDTSQAGFASQAGFLGAGTSLLGGASSFADKWSSYQLRGALPGVGSTGTSSPASSSVWTSD
jgi:hypothetical protein